MQVVVTRPAPEAQRWVEGLRERGIAAVALPLLAIVPAADRKPLQAAWQALDRYGAVMFVSANAVQGFFSVAPGAWPAAGPRAWAPGPATQEALRAAGVPAVQIDGPAADAPQFDSENLWAQVRGQLRAGERLLLVRGADAAGRSAGRDWLAQQLAQAGVTLDTVVAYSRQPAVWSPEQAALAAQRAGEDALWLFSSSEAVSYLRQLAPAADWSRARALASHPRIAEAARALGFGSVQETRPGLEDVVASIESTR